jgi:cytochrome d ubiquinol oxidase subunit II
VSDLLGPIWFLLLGVLLLGYALLDGFDLGVGALHLGVARTDEERRTTMASIGPVWDGNEVWLLTAGGAMFAAFPLVYATVFSGFYLALMLLLAALIFRAVAFEFRGQSEGRAWRTAWDVAFGLGSSLAAVLFGVAVANIVVGLPLDAEGLYTGGFSGLLSPFTVIVGLLSLAMMVLQGATWLVLKTTGPVQARSGRAAWVAWAGLAILWVAVTAWSRSVAPARWTAFEDQPLAFLAPALFVASMVVVPLALRAGREAVAFLGSSGAIVGLMATLGIGLYPALVPSTGVGSDVTVETAASSDLTLSVMLVIALVGMPLVLAYTAFVYHRFRGKVDLEADGYA